MVKLIVILVIIAAVAIYFSVKFIKMFQKAEAWGRINVALQEEVGIKVLCSYLKRVPAESILPGMTEPNDRRKLKEVVLKYFKNKLSDYRFYHDFLSAACRLDSERSNALQRVIDSCLRNEFTMAKMARVYFDCIQHKVLTEQRFDLEKKLIKEWARITGYSFMIGPDFELPVLNALDKFIAESQDERMKFLWERERSKFLLEIDNASILISLQKMEQ